MQHITAINTLETWTLIAVLLRLLPQSQSHAVSRIIPAADI